MIDDQQKVIYSLKKITTRFDRLFRVYGKIKRSRGKLAPTEGALLASFVVAAEGCEVLILIHCD